MSSSEFDALLREAGIAAAAVGQGIHGISNATYAEKGYYHYAFFNLSVAFERLGKLIVIFDHLLTHGSYPTDAELRKLGHRISDLVERAREIRTRRTLSSGQLSGDDITTAIVQTLSDFATSTRYYNLDLIGGKSVSMEEPIAAWYRTVGKPILDKHYSARKRAKDEVMTMVLGPKLNELFLVQHTAEDGSAISTWTEGAIATGKISTLQKYGRMYCLRIVRSLTTTLGELQYEVMKSGYNIPFITDFFRIFNNDDRYFLARKTWNPYRP